MRARSLCVRGVSPLRLSFTMRRYESFIAVHECFPNFFRISCEFFRPPASVTRYSVTVQKTTISVLKILLYLYINIELIFDFQNTCLRTVTLSHCNASTMRKNQRGVFLSHRSHISHGFLWYCFGGLGKIV